MRNESILIARLHHVYTGRNREILICALKMNEGPTVIVYDS